MTKAIKVRFIRMSRELQNDLDYASKLSRQPTHIASLIADGEAQATEFLRGLEKADSLPDSSLSAIAQEIH